MPKQKWGDKEKQAWFSKQRVKRSYKEEVLNKIDRLKSRYIVSQYGSLSIDPDRYPLFLIRTQNWNENNPSVLITGGVHGYETSGVQGALAFLDSEADKFAHHFNFIVAPCVSPWGYETINRWDPLALDPNRSFYENSPAEESAALMKVINNLELSFLSHFDLHETTDTDNTEFLPALAERDASELVIWEIPDGFYVVGDTEKPNLSFQQAIIEEVKTITHIAPSDAEGKIIGEDSEGEGIINYACKKLGLCAGFSNSQFPTTTEVYPDSPSVTDSECTAAQVAAIKGGLNYLLRNLSP